jgi:hypothetical protein
LAGSLLALAGINLSVPTYTQLARRSKALNMPLVQAKLGEAMDILVDSTGFKISGQGEWDTKKHGVQKMSSR